MTESADSRAGPRPIAIGCGGTSSLFGRVETIPFAGGRPTVIDRGPCRATWNA
jgi:hypothetical protein